MRYDQSKIQAAIEAALNELGPEKFSGMKVLKLEEVVRSKQPAGSLPGRSQLRAAIHSFRTARWPDKAPRRRKAAELSS